MYYHNMGSLAPQAVDAYMVAQNSWAVMTELMTIDMDSIGYVDDTQQANNVCARR